MIAAIHVRGFPPNSQLSIIHYQFLRVQNGVDYVREKGDFHSRSGVTEWEDRSVRID